MPAPTVPPTLASIIPPVLIQPGVEQLDSPTTISAETVFTIPSCTMARMDQRKRKMPQCIAHRGYKAKYPENTLLAFDKALEAGAAALETDLHITKDNVVVISHDATLKRCFGRDEKIIDVAWHDIKDLKTIAIPHEPMPRLMDLLNYLAHPGMEHLWLLLDIKLDNNADDITRLIGSTIANAKQSSGKPWSERIILGVWAAKYLPLAERYLPGFSVVHIGFKLSYARHFSTVPNVGFNMLLPMLMAPGGRGFIRDCQEKYHRGLLAWTVNDRDKMEWCIRRGLDGVITDDPSMFVEVCEKHDEYSPEPTIPIGFISCLDMLRIYFTISILFWLFRRKLNTEASPTLIEKLPRQASRGSNLASSLEQ